ncbi:HAMP domain-containing sensor histidine kinase [Actinoplanes sp. NBRC 103695]|uniref:sensor histidine kinase n=1 Tax=Actinoplanes sp. NBRC 103695 TaxID=3032202 RepID=UPI0024A122D9|nr:HAMP domain-containing sensor histidine kinase [Actinoplanes sp. NBRC 103695]GLY94553.1 two-component sensor histidine kinase [Actinoplanes sp. NBRC 103695]
MFRSIRFRLTVLYSTLLFALAGTALAITYFAVAQTTEPQPITERTAKVYENYRPVGVITVGEISEIEAAVNFNTLQNLRNYSLIAMGGLFLASLAIGWVLSGRALRPVGAITRTARDIQATDLSRRIRLTGPRDELRDLADTIDSMLDRLDDAFQAQRQLIDDASHELRSPLAIIRTNLDASLIQTDSEAASGSASGSGSGSGSVSGDDDRVRAVAVIDRATTRMSRLVEDLLATARREAQSESDTEVDLSVVAREAGEESGAEPWRVRYDLAESLHLIGDPDALRRAAGNLLSNAIRLAPAHSVITIATGRVESWLWLAVVDQGPGIAAEDLPRVFDRFWRGTGSSARSSSSSRERRTGLGLAIVRQIVESHGGQVTAHSTLGSGSTFVIWLPEADRTDNDPPPLSSPWPRPAG